LSQNLFIQNIFFPSHNQTQLLQLGRLEWKTLGIR